MPAIFTFEKITVDGTTAQGTDSAKTATGGKKAQKCEITVETNDARMKVNAAPTSTEGVLLKKDVAPYVVTGYDVIKNLQFIAVTPSSVINIQYTLL